MSVKPFGMISISSALGSLTFKTMSEDSYMSVLFAAIVAPAFW